MIDKTLNFIYELICSIIDVIIFISMTIVISFVLFKGVTIIIKLVGGV